MWKSNSPAVIFLVLNKFAKMKPICLNNTPWNTSVSLFFCLRGLDGALSQALKTSCWHYLLATFWNNMEKSRHNEIATKRHEQQNIYVFLFTVNASLPNETKIRPISLQTEFLKSLIWTSCMAINIVRQRKLVKTTVWTGAIAILLAGFSRLACMQNLGDV